MPDRHPPAAAAARRTAVHLILALLLATIAAAIITPARAGALEAGVADQKAWVWKDPRIRALGLRHARLIVPWNAATSEPAVVQAWLDATAAEGIQPHVAFERLRSDRCPYAPCTPPSVAQYRAAIDAFIARFPQVRTYTTWNEVNHQSQPVRTRPDLVAGYYRQLTAACPGCTVVAGDVLDSGNFTGWLRSFLSSFEDPPQLWGIHNYGDASRGTTAGTDAVLATVPGTVWMEETGGIVQLRGALSGGGSTAAAEAQSAAAIDQAFAIARTRPRIGRLYVYQVQAWPNDTFDSGIFRPDGTSRPGYATLLRNLSNLGQVAAAGTPTPAPVAAPTATVRWSARRGGRLVATVRCAGGAAACSGSVRLSVRTRGARARTWQVKTVATRSYAATTGTATVQVAVPARLRARLRRAARREAVARIAQVQPATATATARRRLPRP